MTNTGINYIPARNVKETAKLIRKALKTEYKGCKFSVTISRYSGGQSIHVEIKALPEGFGLVLNSETDPEFGCHLMTDKANDLRRNVEALVNSFNRRDIDSQVDYFNVDFFSSVRFANALRHGFWLAGYVGG